MDNKLKRIYVPMTETGFYILFCLQKPQHGYGIRLQVKKMTDGEVSISAGTMYGTLSNLDKDGLIAFFAEKEKRKLYQITPLGREKLDLEIIYIDDGAKDNTAAEGRKLHETDVRVHLVSFSRNFGK